MATTFKRLSHPADVPHLAVALKRYITNIQEDYSTLDSPVFTGDPQAPTPPTGDNDTSIATTEFVKNQNYLTGNQTITLSGDVTGSGATAITTTLRNSGVTAGTYNNLTVSAKGVATAGSNVAYLTANQTITLSGDVSGSGTTAIPAAVNSVTGVTTNSNAAAGKVGEVISSVNTTGVAAAGSVVAVTSIILTAGDWDVMGEVFFIPGTGAMTTLQASINTVAATHPGTVNMGTAMVIAAATTVGGYTLLPLSPTRASLAATTTYYLNAVQNGGTGVTVQGKIWARRAR